MVVKQLNSQFGNVDGSKINPRFGNQMEIVLHQDTKRPRFQRNPGQNIVVQIRVVVGGQKQFVDVALVVPDGQVDIPHGRRINRCIRRITFGVRIHLLGEPQIPPNFCGNVDIVVLPVDIFPEIHAQAYDRERDIHAIIERHGDFSGTRPTFGDIQRQLNTRKNIGRFIRIVRTVLGRQQFIDGTDQIRRSVIAVGHHNDNFVGRDGAICDGLLRRGQIQVIVAVARRYAVKGDGHFERRELHADHLVHGGGQLNGKIRGLGTGIVAKAGVDGDVFRHNSHVQGIQRTRIKIAVI